MFLFGNIRWWCSTSDACLPRAVQAPRRECWWVRCPGRWAQLLLQVALLTGASNTPGNKPPGRHWGQELASAHKWMHQSWPCCPQSTCKDGEFLDVPIWVSWRRGRWILRLQNDVYCFVSAFLLLVLSDCNLSSVFPMKVALSEQSGNRAGEWTVPKTGER